MSANPGQGNFGPPDPSEFFDHLKKPTSVIVDRMAEVLREHIWYFVGNLGVPGMADRHGYKCTCGWETRDDSGRSVDDPHAHVAQQIATKLPDVLFICRGCMRYLSTCVKSPCDERVSQWTTTKENNA